LSPARNSDPDARCRIPATPLRNCVRPEASRSRSDMKTSFYAANPMSTDQHVGAVGRGEVDVGATPGQRLPQAFGRERAARRAAGQPQMQTPSPISGSALRSPLPSASTPPTERVFDIAFYSPRKGARVGRSDG